MGVGPAHVAVQRELQLVGGGLGHGQRHPEHGVGAESLLVVGAVEVDEHPIDVTLIERVEPHQGVVDLVVDVGHGVEHALAAEAVVAVAQLHGLELPGGRARRHDGAPGRARIQHHLHLDGGVAARVEHLTPDDVFDDAHRLLLLLLVFSSWHVGPLGPRIPDDFVQ